MIILMIILDSFSFMIVIGQIKGHTFSSRKAKAEFSIQGNLGDSRAPKIDNGIYIHKERRRDRGACYNKID